MRVYLKKEGLDLISSFCYLTNNIHNLYDNLVGGPLSQLSTFVVILLVDFGRRVLNIFTLNLNANYTQECLLVG